MEVATSGMAIIGKTSTEFVRNAITELIKGLSLLNVRNVTTRLSSRWSWFGSQDYINVLISLTLTLLTMCL